MIYRASALNSVPFGYRRGGGHSTGAEAELAFAADLPDFGGCDTIHSDTEVRPLDGVELLRRLRGLIGRECTYLGRSCRLLEILSCASALRKEYSHVILGSHIPLFSCSTKPSDGVSGVTWNEFAGGVD